MMKKFLVLLMVLGIATTASAALQLSINGDMDPRDSKYTIEPGDHLVLGIWTDSKFETVEEAYFALLAPTALATISGGVPAEWTILIYDDAAGNGINVPPGDNGVFGYIATPPGAVFSANMLLIDLIDFRCEDVGDAKITLYSLDGETGDLLGELDSVIIHQIPEPMTMALLGLGGLFLRRRK